MTVTMPELMQILGVSMRTVQRLTQEGVFPAQEDPRDKRKRVFPLEECVQAYIKNQVEKSAGKDRAERIQALEEKKLAAEAELKESQRDLHVLKTEIANGKYLSVEEVQMDYSRFFVAVKKFLTATPARLTAMVAGYVDPVAARGMEKELSAEVDNLLRNFVAAGVTK